MSEAYATTLDISFDVRGGLLMRQIHHWAALIFVAAMAAHMFRVFFTGAFRKPRELNWVIGVVLTTLALGAGFTGYSLPDDLLSGTGLRIIEGVMLSIPIAGTWLSFLIFGGEFPGTEVIGRLYGMHILLIPGLILGLLTVHLMLVWYQKHTQFPGPGRTNDNVVGYPLMPVYMAKAGGFFFLVFGIIVLIAGTVSINPVWLFGPYTPDQVSAGTQPDWYIGWIDGALRVMPNLEVVLLGYTFSLNVLIPAAVIPGIIFTLLGAYPWIERWATGDYREHNLLDRPRDRPTRTGLGVMAITFYTLLFAAGGNDIIALAFNLSINELIWFFRITVDRPAAHHVPHHQADLPEPAAAGPGQTAARLRDRPGAADARRRVHRGPRRAVDRGARQDPRQGGSASRGAAPEAATRPASATRRPRSAGSVPRSRTSSSATPSPSPATRSWRRRPTTSPNRPIWKPRCMTRTSSSPSSATAVFCTIRASPSPTASSEPRRTTNPLSGGCRGFPELLPPAGSLRPSMLLSASAAGSCQERAGSSPCGNNRPRSLMADFGRVASANRRAARA